MSNLKKRTLLALYLSNSLVPLLIQAGFLAILIRILLPKVNGLPVSESTRTKLYTAYTKNVSETLSIHKSKGINKIACARPILI